MPSTKPAGNGGLTRAFVVALLDRSDHADQNAGGLVSISLHSTGAPKSVALGFPSRFARRRPVNAVR